MLWEKVTELGIRLATMALDRRQQQEERNQQKLTAALKGAREVSSEAIATRVKAETLNEKLKADLVRVRALNQIAEDLIRSRQK